MSRAILADAYCFYHVLKNLVNHDIDMMYNPLLIRILIFEVYTEINSLPNMRYFTSFSSKKTLFCPVYFSMVYQIRQNSVFFHGKESK